MNFADGNFELKEIQTLQSHTDRIWSLAWNSTSGVDGVPALISSCGADKTVRIWEQNPDNDDSFFCKTVLEDQHAETVRWCVWSPNGKLLATSSFDGDTAIWENVGGNFSCVHVLEECEKIAQSISWNASGTLLATCVPCRRISIRKVLSNKMFDTASVVLAGVENVKIVQWHPLKDTLFSSGFDSTIKVWEEKDTGKWDCVQTLGEPNSESMNAVQAFAFNDSADKIVSCSDDSTIKIWGSEIKKTQSGEENTIWTCLCTLSGYHDGRILSIHWSRDGIICSGSIDKAICLFVESEDDSVDGPTYKLLLKKEQAHDKGINAVQWNSMGNRRLASASDDRTIKIWKLVSSN